MTVMARRIDRTTSNNLDDETDCFLKYYLTMEKDIFDLSHYDHSELTARIISYKICLD